MTSVLEVKNLSRRFGDLAAVDGLSFEVRPGEVFGLLGPNGAGKTTTFHLLTGLLAPDAGEFFLNGKKSDPTDGRSRVSVGVAFQKPSVDGKLTGRENLEMGAVVRRNSSEVKADLAWVCELFPMLLQKRRIAARALSGGEQQMVVIGRALMSRPRLLLMDEPFAGLSPAVVDHVVGVIETIQRRGTGILLIEQNVEIALETSHYAYILKNGFIVVENESRRLIDQPEIRWAYLGGRPPASAPAAPPSMIEPTG